MARTKYIKTKNNEIIIFSELQQHSEFRYFNPVSAGFIAIGMDDIGNPNCTCYGESISLDLKSMEDIDTRLANRQIFGLLY